MTDQPPDVEILVHITAPSHARHDVTYRELAQAYLAFEPQQRVELSHARSSPELGRTELKRKSQHISQSFSSVIEGDPSQHVQLPDLLSQDLSFQSALDNRSSPALPVSRFEITQEVVQIPSSITNVSDQSSWVQPPSQISDSYPLPDADILHVSPTRVLQRFLGRNSNFTQPNTARPATRASQASLEMDSSPGVTLSSSLLTQPLQQSQAGKQSLQNTRQIIPVTPLCSKPIVRPKPNLNQEYDDTVVNETTHIPSSIVTVPSSSLSFRAESEPPPSKRLKTASELAGGPLSLIRSSSDTCQSRTRATKYVDQSLEIMSPSPPVGMSDIKPSDLVSKKLAKLATDLSSRYRPIIKRGVEAFDRGYWHLDCTTWSSETRLDTWKFLVNYVGSGLAGWGVWCRRDASHDSIRLYCWGHIVKHTYLLLYLASGRQLKTTGAKWIGADGEVSLEVLPQGRQG